MIYLLNTEVTNIYLPVRPAHQREAGMTGLKHLKTQHTSMVLGGLLRVTQFHPVATHLPAYDDQVGD